MLLRSLTVTWSLYLSCTNAHIWILERLLSGNVDNFDINTNKRLKVTCGHVRWGAVDRFWHWIDQVNTFGVFAHFSRHFPKDNCDTFVVVCFLILNWFYLIGVHCVHRKYKICLFLIIYYQSIWHLFSNWNNANFQIT